MTIYEELFPFQKEDVDWLEDEPGVLIANEMGSGKTYEALALDEMRRMTAKAGGGKATLIVCPLSSIQSTWAMHIERLCPWASYTFIDPKNRGQFEHSVRMQAFDFYIVHWDALRLLPSLAEIRWFHVIADEVHRAKNRKAQSVRALKKIKATYKTGLSGTPVTNRPGDYWSILNWLYPKQYKGYWDFYKRYTEYEIVYPNGYHKQIGVLNADELQEKLRPFYVRHLKKEQCCPHHPEGIMPDLPDKYYTDIWVDLSPQQRRVFDQMSKDLLAWVGEHEDQPLIAPVVISKLVRLQQFAIAYAEVEFDGPETTVRLAEPSSKLDALMDLIQDNEDEQFVVFSQFSKAIYLLRSRLEKAEISHGIFTGDTKPDDRARMVEEFQAGKLRVFAGTIKAGGIGLDLFSASTVVFLDRSWSPAENRQAEDRLHRSGQKNAVQVIDIMARNTVDLGRRATIQIKWSWIRKLLGDE